MAVPYTTATLRGVDFYAPPIFICHFYEGPIKFVITVFDYSLALSNSETQKSRPQALPDEAANTITKLFAEKVILHAVSLSCLLKKVLMSRRRIETFVKVLLLKYPRLLQYSIGELDYVILKEVIIPLPLFQCDHLSR